MLKGNINYPSTVSSAYDMLTNFELSYPTSRNIECKGDKGNKENDGGHGGRDHTFFQHTVTSGKVFITGIDGHTSYFINCFDCEKWGNYENQCPEPTQDSTSNKSGVNMAQISRCLTQGSIVGAVSDKWLLLDSCYNISCAKNNTIV